MALENLYFQEVNFSVNISSSDDMLRMCGLELSLCFQNRSGIFFSRRYRLVLHFSCLSYKNMFHISSYDVIKKFK